MDEQHGCRSRVIAAQDETITVNPDGLGQVTICCESGSSVEINFNTKHFHFHQATFDTDQLKDIVMGK